MRFLWFVLRSLFHAFTPELAMAPAQKTFDPPVLLSGGTLVDVIRGEVYPDVGVLAEGGKTAGLFFDLAYDASRSRPVRCGST